jgi:spore coat protein U-like protein
MKEATLPDLINYSLFSNAGRTVNWLKQSVRIQFMSPARSVRL